MLTPAPWPTCKSASGRCGPNRRTSADARTLLDKALQIFRREIDLSMAQMGAAKIADLGPQFVMWKDEEDLRRNRR